MSPSSISYYVRRFLFFAKTGCSNGSERLKIARSEQNRILYNGSRGWRKITDRSSGSFQTNVSYAGHNFYL